ncbi:MAG TPA: nucleotidyltransferase family protein [Chitinophagaceae bacterium]|nr:nucleotidyltransferase family protein [Chitinophagaceae bacterium]
MNLPEGTKAMIFAAGLGTRLKPFTDQHPKALALVNQKPLLQRNIEYLAGFGIKDIVVNVHHFAEQVISFLAANNNFGLNIVISHEITEPLETGGGLKKAEWFFSESNLPFVVMNADILTDLDLGKMYRFHNDKKGIATLAVTNRTSSRNLLFDENHLLVGWENINSGEQKISRPGGIHFKGAFSGVHIIDPALLAMISREGKFSIIDTYLELAETENIFVFNHTGDEVVDVGKPESIIKAEKIFK